MKQLFLTHLRQEPQGKVLLRLAETISTVDSMEEVSQRSATLSQSGHLRKDNQRSPSDGGEEHLAEQTFGPDERQDEPTFALLAELSGSIPTLFDLRGLRPKLHAIPSEKLGPLEANLVYWADSYDYLICYPTVSPLLNSPPDMH